MSSLTDLLVLIGAIGTTCGVGLVGWGCYVSHRGFVWQGILLSCTALWLILSTVAVSGLLRLLAP